MTGSRASAGSEVVVTVTQVAYCELHYEIAASALNSTTRLLCYDSNMDFWWNILWKDRILK